VPAKRSQITFQAFLSHRYESPDINLYFFDIFSRAALVQFEIDKKTKHVEKKDPNWPSLSVTRLERMIRGADAFIGIYPFAEESTQTPPAEALLHASRYFRLELDLAIRSGRPAIVFHDRRYGDLLQGPDSVTSVDFDAREIGVGRRARGIGAHQKAFEEFGEQVRLAMSHRDAVPDSRRHRRVGLLLPPAGQGGSGYGSEEREIIAAALKEYSRTDLDWPPTLDLAFLRKLREMDWVLADLGSESAQTGIPAYLHGQFVPMMRVRRLSASESETGLTALEESLYGGVEVGYRKDILRWRTGEHLRDGLRYWVELLDVDSKLITRSEEALDYFQDAALREEGIFVSYAGEDRDMASQLAEALRKRFRMVFDYQDGQSIPAGDNWLKTVFDRLKTSAVSIPLLSKHYLASKNCLHEAEQAVALRDNERKHVIPIRLYKDDGAKPPAFLESIQYKYWSDFRGPDKIADYVVNFLKERGS
jgi:hypothetical protein